MHELHNSVDFDNFIYHYKGPTKDKDVNMYDNAKSLYDMIKNKSVTLSHAQENQADLE